MMLPPARTVNVTTTAAIAPITVAMPEMPANIPEISVLVSYIRM